MSAAAAVGNLPQFTLIFLEVAGAVGGGQQLRRSCHKASRWPCYASGFGFSSWLRVIFGIPAGEATGENGGEVEGVVESGLEIAHKIATTGADGVKVEDTGADGFEGSIKGPREGVSGFEGGVEVAGVDSVLYAGEGEDGAGFELAGILEFKDSGTGEGDYKCAGGVEVAGDFEGDTVGACKGVGEVEFTGLGTDALKGG